ncbi:hypothetical protein [Pseudofrankia inefficax]|uniref:hypothetical protein n=1 Tax=Pseudofrankia inefficax (strain DSM 45817 / CECT 9037 / DDB 130130 / EuI1c) TaxID=298654 RepID=UPI00030530C1|nr:hypothetical protein [Pseudofrankia inefficax]
MIGLLLLLGDEQHPLADNGTSTLTTPSASRPATAASYPTPSPFPQADTTVVAAPSALDTTPPGDPSTLTTTTSAPTSAAPVPSATAAPGPPTAAQHPALPAPTSSPPLVLIPLAAASTTSRTPTPAATTPPSVTITASAVPDGTASPDPSPSPSPSPSPTASLTMTPIPIITLTPGAKCDVITVVPASLAATVDQTDGHTTLTLTGSYAAPASAAPDGQTTIHTDVRATATDDTPLLQADTTVPTQPADAPAVLATIDLDELPAPAPTTLTLTLTTTPASCAPVNLATVVIIDVAVRPMAPAGT